VDDQSGERVGVRRGRDGSPLQPGARFGRRGALTPEERAELEANSKGDDDVGVDIAIILGGPNDYGVLNNDLVEDSLANVKVDLVTKPQNASLFDLNSDGTFSYIPNDGFSGEDSFQYKFTSGSPPESSETATVWIQVESPREVDADDQQDTLENDSE
jgi:hypothetical protein